MKAFLFGAGSSCGTLGAPTSRDFGRELGQVDRNWQRNYRAILEVVKHLGLSYRDWGLEEVWSYIDFYAKLRQAIPEAPDRKKDSPEIKLALLAVYGRRLDRLANCLPKSESYTLGYLFTNEVACGDVLISFNYDTVVERLAKRFDHRLRVADVETTKPCVTLVKPHGSTSWTLDLRNHTLDWHSSLGSPRLHSLGRKDVKESREPLLLGAVPIKSELIWQVQSAGGTCCVFETIMKQWKAVVEAVRDADSLIVVGYGFPKEDHYGRFLIEQGLRLRKFAPGVEFYELREHRCRTASAIMDIMTKVFGPNVSPPMYRGTVTPPSNLTSSGDA